MNQFLEELAAGNPTPGGGGAAAVAGALAASLAQMVANLTIGRRKYSHVEEEVSTLRQQAEELSVQLYGAIEADAYVYTRVMQIFQLRTGNNDATAIQAIEDALVGAAEVPLNVVRRCREVIFLLEKLAEIGNKHATADAVAGAFLARAAIQISVLNMKTNLKEVQNEKLKKSWLNQANRIAKETDLLVDQIAEQAEKRIFATKPANNRRRRKRN